MIFLFINESKLLPKYLAIISGLILLALDIINLMVFDITSDVKFTIKAYSSKTPPNVKTPSR